MRDCKHDFLFFKGRIGITNKDGKKTIYPVLCCNRCKSLLIRTVDYESRRVFIAPNGSPITICAPNNKQPEENQQKISTYPPQMGKKPNDFSDSVIETNESQFFYRINSESKIEGYVVRKRIKKCSQCGKKLYLLLASTGKNHIGKKCGVCGRIYFSYEQYKFLEKNQSVVCINEDLLKEIEEEKKGEERIRLQELQSNEVLPKVKAVLPKAVVVVPHVSDEINDIKNIICSCDVKCGAWSAKIWVCYKGKSDLLINETLSEQYISFASPVGEAILRAIANDDIYFEHKSNKIVICNRKRYDAVFVDKYKKKKAPEKTVESSYREIDKKTASHEFVYVYYKLSNSCTAKKHMVDSVTLYTENLLSKKEIKVNAYYCQKCNRYFVNYEAIEGLTKRKILPALRYSIVDETWGTLNPISELMMYGYNVKEGVLSTAERHMILAGIIDAGLMRKHQIVANIQSKIDYNGKQKRNASAKQKWEEDIDFVNHYIVGNSRSIRGTIYRS